VQTPNRTLVVDTAAGNAKPRTGPMFNMLDTDFLEAFRGICDPTDVDSVVCTHLHADHVGWNTHLVDGKWIPTFASAAHYFVEQEYRYWETYECGFSHFDAAAVFADSVQPVADAGLVTFVEPSDRLTPEVTLIPSHGHTPGHVSVLIESKGQSAVITGDLMHFPCQIGYPGWSSIYDADQEASSITRRVFLDRFADNETMVIGTHFATPTGVFVHRYGESFRLSPAG
jgi:glyoxylase-like metal-dependent hydrolase (beta-lactamase superfamily II)